MELDSLLNSPYIWHLCLLGFLVSFASPAKRKPKETAKRKSKAKRKPKKKKAQKPKGETKTTAKRNERNETKLSEAEQRMFDAYIIQRSFKK